MATPTRIGSRLPARRKTPQGRFWIGKSAPGSLAAATQLRSAGSWVSLSMVSAPGATVQKRWRMPTAPLVALASSGAEAAGRVLVRVRSFISIA
jgi:hypothetical protein